MTLRYELALLGALIAGLALLHCVFGFGDTRGCVKPTAMPATWFGDCRR